jgi:serine phosphatase RsbU (regulator of sigma subunit)
MLSGLAALALGDLAGTDTARVPYAILHEVVPDAATSGDISLVVSRIKSGRPPVCIVVAPPGPLDQEELNVLRQLGQSLALVMETLRSYAEEHLIALTLQRSLLPSRLPQIPGLSLAVRYEPASAQAEVGGDFYEVLRIGHRVLVAIGDVQGHSLHAATVMAEVRHALRAFVEEGHGLAQILVWLNRVMLRYHDDQTATVCLMLIDPADGSLEIANAGHPPPLLIEGDQAKYTRHGGVLIGFPGGMPSTEEATLPIGGAVILITDGLVEDRGVSLADNLERLRVLSLTIEEDLEKFSDRILAEFGHREDDVALVVLRRD